MEQQVVQQEDTKRLYALDCISQMCYVSKMNIEYCTMAMKFLPQSGLKDTMLMYRENQKNWLSKVLKSLRDYGTMAGVDLHKNMVEDLEDMPMVAMFDIIGNLKMAKDMEGIATVVDELCDLPDATPILTNLVAIIRNEKNKQL